MSHHRMMFAGLDLAQTRDFTALSILEQREAEDSETTLMRYDLNFLRRWSRGTPYTQICDDVEQIIDRLWDMDCQACLVVDQTGVGRPVVDMLQARHVGRMYPVTITAGHEVTREGNEYRVPKRDLVTSIDVLLQSARLQIASDLELAETLVEELSSFRVKISAAGRDSYGAGPKTDWRAGVHDDLVLATALAAWFAEHAPRPSHGIVVTGVATGGWGHW